MLGNNWHKKEMPLVSLAGMGGGLSSPAFLSSLILNITKPTVFSPVDDTGVPDFTYNALSSAIANVGTVDALGDAPAFSTTLYAGNGDGGINGQSINTGIDNTSESLVWIKARNGSSSQYVENSLFDTLRGPENIIRTESSGKTLLDINSLLSFDADGFTTGGSAFTNLSGNNYVAWNFSAEPGFFDIVTYDGDSNAGREIPHNLGSIPGMILIKCISDDGTDGITAAWTVHHKSLPNTEILRLNTSDDPATSNHFHNTSPTDQVFTVGSGLWVNSSLGNRSYVAYLFADNPSNQIKCSSYLGNATGGGDPAVPNQIECGFRPKFVLIKNVNSDTNWHMFDDQMDGKWLLANETDQQGYSTPQALQFNDTGFSLHTGYHHVNWDNAEHIYLAIGSPKTIISDTQLTLTDTTVSKASDGSLVEGATINEVLTVGERIQADTTVSSTITVPVFSTTLWTGDNSDNRPLSTGIDNSDKSLVWIKCRTEPKVHILMDTERGTNSLLFTNERYPVQTGSSLVKSFNSDGFTLGDNTNVNQLNQDFVAWNFRAAPEFFDIVTYTGDGGFDKTISHNLGSTPACVIIKRMDNNSEWMLAHAFDGGNNWSSTSANFAHNALRLNQADPSTTDSSYVGCKDATPTEFTVYQGSTPAQLHGPNHSDATYIAYLFANTSGLIKCGKTSYLPGATTEEVVCGFKPAFVLAKCVSETGLWVMVDIERGLHPQHSDASYLYPSKTEREGSSYETMNMNANEDGFILKATNGAGEYVYIAIAENAETDISSLVTPEATVSASSGNVITLSDVSGPWSTGMRIRGIDSDLKDYPDAILPQDISLTSSSPIAEKTVNTWGDAVWEVATDAAFTQNVQTSSTALSVSGTQSGPTFSYNSNTGYYVRTKYTALGQESAWSDTNYFATQLAIDIAKPIILTPIDDTGVPDFDYTAESSAITNISNQTTLDDFENITSRSGNYEYIESDQNGSVFVTVDVSGGSYFEISQDGGSSWTNSNTVTSSPWISLRGHCFVDSPSYKGFIFGSYGPTGSGGHVPTYKSAQGNYVSWSQAGTIPSYTSSYGRYDELATDNTGFIVACGSHSNVAYSTNNADSWTRVSPGSGGTNTSLPHWTTCTYFAKLGKFVIGGNNTSSAGNKVYLSGDKSQVQSGNWTIHDSTSNPSGIDDMACNDDYLFTLSGSWSGSSVWRTSDLISWTKIADFEATNPDMCPYKIKVKGSTVILIDTIFRGPNTGDIIVSTDNGANWTYKRINPSDTFGSYDAAIDKDNNIVVVNDRKSPKVARTKLNETTELTIADTTVSKISDGSLIGGTTISQALTVGETVQSSGGTESYWIATLGGSSTYDFGKDIAVDSSGNVYVTGETDNGGQYDLVIAKYNPSGNIEWQRTLANESGPGIAVDISDNAYVIGRTTSAGAGNNDFSIAKYNPSGGIEWQRTLGNTNSDQGYDITTDSSGGVYVTGHGRDIASGGSVSFDGVDDHLKITGQSDLAFGTSDFTLECWVYFTGSDGTLDTIMETRSSTGGSDGFLIGRFHTGGHENKIELYTAGNYSVTADVTTPDNTWVHVAAVRQSGKTRMYLNGQVQSATYSDYNNYSNDDLIIGENIAGSYQIPGYISNFRMVKGTAVYTSNFTPTGPLTAITNTKLLCCQSTSSVTTADVTPATITNYQAIASSSSPFGGGLGSDDILIAKYNSLGNIQWQVSLGDSAANYVEAITVDGSGNVYVAGSTSYGAYRMYVSKLNSSGSVQWTRLLGDGQGTSADGIAVDSSGNVYVTGKCRRSGYTDNELWLVKYDSSGNLQSQVTLGATNTDRGSGITIDSSDNVYVVGTSNSAGTGTYDYIIAKYNPSGGIEWQNVLSASGSDQGQNIATDNSGNIYVTGYSDSAGAGNSMDWLIAKLPADGSLHGIYGSFTYAAASALTPGTTSFSSDAHTFTSSTSNLFNSESFLNEEESFLDSSTISIASESGTVSASSGNTITLSDVSGTWSTGMKVQGVTADTKDHPDAISSDNVSLTSSEPTISSGTITSWDTATWQVATDENFTQNVQTETSALSATGTQTGPSFSLEADTGYYTRTKYTALGQESDWSDVTYFVTKPQVYADDLFSTYLYEGTDSTQTINNGIDLAGEGGMVWIKRRDYGYSNVLFDTERGVHKRIYSNMDSAESTNTATVTSFNSDGFSIGDNSFVNSGPTDPSGPGDHVSWTFRKAPGFFDIQTWTGNGVEGRQIPHNLGSTPGMIIIKRTGGGGAENWVVYHRSMGIGQNLTLNEDYAANSFAYVTSVSDTAFGVSMQFQTNGNDSSATYVAYIFAHDDESFGTSGDESIINCGSFTTDSSGNWSEINLGFEPQWLLIKRSDSSTAGTWVLLDNMRGLGAGESKFLYPNLSNEEASNSFGFVHLTPTGFKGASATQQQTNATYIYMAIRRPHKPPTAGTDVFAMAQSVANAEPSAVSGFPVDMAIRTDVTTEQTRSLSARLMAGNFLYTNNTNVEAGTTNFNFDYSNGVSNISLTGYDHYMFRRAPGFFDVTTWVGTGSNKTINHNLGVVPELVIVKNRDTDRAWMVWSSYLSNDSDFLAFTTGSYMNDSNVWQANSTFTSTQFGVGSNHDVNKYNDNLIAFLFASLDGISKIGTFSGTGSDINVDCGFTAGARFVMIKRIDAGRVDTHWYVFDTMHGIVSGNDNYFALNDKNAYSTSYNYIDPLNAGFTVTSAASANSGLNEDGATYLFLAIA